MDDGNAGDFPFEEPSSGVRANPGAGRAAFKGVDGFALELEFRQSHKEEG
jgi:hypothetical protein